jgi:hypothetical protein
MTQFAKRPSLLEGESELSVLMRAKQQEQADERLDSEELESKDKRDDHSELEAIAHELALTGQLKPEQEKILEEHGYSRGTVTRGPLGFAVEVWDSSQPDHPPIVVFSGEGAQDGLVQGGESDPVLIGKRQFAANQRRLQQVLPLLGGKAWFVGAGFGGALAQRAAAAYPKQVARVMTFDSPSVDGQTVADLEGWNSAVNADDAVLSVHHQMIHDAMGHSGKTLTPGSMIKYQFMQGQTAAMGKQLLTQILTNPTTSKSMGHLEIENHRAFPAGSVAQESAVFKDLLEKGKKFDKVAGIDAQAFQAGQGYTTDVLKDSKTAEFLHHTVNRDVFEFGKANGNAEQDLKAREWAESNKNDIQKFDARTLIEKLNHILNGWVDDDDVVAFETICYGIKDPKITREIQSDLRGRLNELHDDKQRKWIEDALNYQPPEVQVQRDKLSGSDPLALNSPEKLEGGRSIQTDLRRELEQFFGMDLQAVRVHEGAQADVRAKALNARAYAQDDHVVLSSEARADDEELMAHEVAHIKQQREGRVPKGVDASSALEQEALDQARAFAGRSKTLHSLPKKWVLESEEEQEPNVDEALEARVKPFLKPKKLDVVSERKVRGQDAPIEPKGRSAKSESRDPDGA